MRVAHIAYNANACSEIFHAKREGLVRLFSWCYDIARAVAEVNRDFSSQRKCSLILRFSPSAPLLLPPPPSYYLLYHSPLPHQMLKIIVPYKVQGSDSLPSQSLREYIFSKPLAKHIAICIFLLKLGNHMEPRPIGPASFHERRMAELPVP